MILCYHPCARQWALVLLLSGRLVLASAQTWPEQPYDGCESVGIVAHIPEITIRGLCEPAWKTACFNPANSKQVAAVWSERAADSVVHRNLYVLKVNTHEQKLILRDVGCDLSWSRTGWLVVERAGQLWRLKATGDSLTCLTAPATPSRLPAWSPDGRLLACLQQQDIESPGGDIVLLTPAGRVVRRLVVGPATHLISAPAWSPDGRKLAFIGKPVNENSDYFIYEFDLKTSRTRRLFSFEYHAQSWMGVPTLRWLKNGKALVCRTTYQGLSIIQVATGESRVVWNQPRLLSLDMDANTQRALVIYTDLRPIDAYTHNTFCYAPVLCITNLNGSHQTVIK